MEARRDVKPFDSIVDAALNQIKFGCVASLGSTHHRYHHTSKILLHVAITPYSTTFTITFILLIKIYPSASTHPSPPR